MTHSIPKLPTLVPIRNPDTKRVTESSFPALEIHYAHNTDPEVYLSHQLGDAALPALQL